MSVQSLVGLLALNALFVVVGIALLWWVRGLATWAEVMRLDGVAYLADVAGTGSIWTLLVIVGVPFRSWTVVAVPLLEAGGLALAARRRGRALPRWAWPSSDRRALVGAAGIALTGVLLEALFRGARLAGLYSWDAWSFWVPKAKILYFSGGIDKELFAALPNSSYPPFVPVLDAAAFHAMGSADVVTLHVQYVLLGVGFVWALAGVLAERVPAWILWPFVLLVLVAPRIGRRFFVTEADLLLDFLFVLAALLLVLWLLDGHRWRLVVATILMSAMVLTKREGLLLVAVLIIAAGIASLREWRVVWPRLAATVGVVAVVAAPWRIWYVVHGIPGEGSPTGTASADRLWPSMRLALDVLFSSEYWNVIVPVAIGATVLAAFARQFLVAGFAAVSIVLVTIAGGLITYFIPELPITQELGGNPIVRFMGAAALLSVSASPLLLGSAWAAVTERDRGAAP